MHVCPTGVTIFGKTVFMVVAVATAGKVGNPGSVVALPVVAVPVPVACLTVMFIH